MQRKDMKIGECYAVDLFPRVRGMRLLGFRVGTGTGVTTASMQEVDINDPALPLIEDADVRRIRMRTVLAPLDREALVARRRESEEAIAAQDARAANFIGRARRLFTALDIAVAPHLGCHDLIEQTDRVGARCQATAHLERVTLTGEALDKLLQLLEA